MSVPFDRPPPKKAGPELLVLQKWEAFLGWLLDHTAKWPKAARFTLTRRVENHALDVLELLVVARYEPGSRRRSLREARLDWRMVGESFARRRGKGTHAALDHARPAPPAGPERRRR